MEDGLFALITLARAGRTGALHVGGRPGGAVYLVAGRISYAETPACPGLEETLVGSGRLPAPVWRAAYEAGRRDAQVGRILLRDGHLGPRELAARLGAATGAALHEILRGDGPVWFMTGERHWFGNPVPVARPASRSMTHTGCDRESQRARKMAHCDGRENKIPPEGATRNRG